MEGKGTKRKASNDEGEEVFVNIKIYLRLEGTLSLHQGRKRFYLILNKLDVQ